MVIKQQNNFTSLVRIINQMWEGYHGGGGRPRKMTRKQVEEMINNMKKTGIVNKKSNEYHKQEEKEADNILKQIQNNDK